MIINKNPVSAEGILGNWQKLEKGENFYQSQLSLISVCSACLEKKIKFHNVSSFSNPELLLTELSFTRMPSVFLLYILSTWLGFLLTREMHAGCGSSFGLSSGVTEDLGKVDGDTT